MPLPLLIHAVGSIGLFASRAFLPAFATAMALRFGPDVPWIAALGLLDHVRGVPTWFTSNPCLVILGLLSAVELVAERQPEARPLLGEVRDLLKVGMAVLTFAGVASASDLAMAGGILGDSWSGPLQVVASTVVGAATFGAAKVRRATLEPIRTVDEDDDLGVQGLIDWVEDFWGLLGPILLIVLPLLTLGMLAVATLAVGVVRRYAERRGDAATITCASCEAAISSAALACPRCHAVVKGPRAIGVLGTVVDRPAEPSRHPLRLFAAGRCPTCATRLGRRTAGTACPACERVPTDDPRFLPSFVALVDGRVPLVLALCGAFGLVPILGVIPGVITYRLMLVAPFRRHLPSGRRFAIRWAVRLAVLALVAFQWVPVAGALVLPLMASINYAVYRSAFRGAALDSRRVAEAELE